MKYDYHEFINSEFWDTLRKFAYELFGHRCWFCDQKGELHLHHTKYFKTTLTKTKRLLKNNMRWFLVVCADCHTNIHSIQKAQKLEVYLATKIYRDALFPKKKMWFARAKINRLLKQM